MEAGLQIFNETGSIQIDSNYKNLALVAKYNVTPAVATVYNPGGTGQLYYADIILGVAQPIVAARCAQECIAWQFLNASGQQVVRVFSPRVVVEVFVFRVGANSGAPYGVEVFNARGELTFSATAGYPRVIDAVQGNKSLPVFGGTYSFNSQGKKLAIITNSWGRQLTAMPGNSPGRYNIARLGVCFRNLSETQVRLTGYLLTTQFDASSAPPDYIREPSYILVDVSNI
ncbi:hypothetical protein ABRP29_22980 [Pseudomonas sp. WHRI 8822A]|uniref:hypothetical protein n=1 Tax=Pseudomonas sp. WHRI 8822A TaxID=3162568 RepID=UPI0032ED0425